LCPSGSFRPDSMMTALSTTSSYSSSSSSYGGSCPRSKRTGGTLAAAEAATVAVAGEQQQQQNHVTCKEVGSPIQQHPVSNSPLAANRGTTEEVSYTQAVWFTHATIALCIYMIHQQMRACRAPCPLKNTVCRSDGIASGTCLSEGVLLSSMAPRKSDRYPFVSTPAQRSGDSTTAQSSAHTA
jgi:hypothetical protein